MDTIVDDLSLRLASRLKMERRARGLSAGALAQRAGVSRAMVAKIEAGKSSPTAMLLGRLSGALGLSLSTLLARAEDAGGRRLVRLTEQHVWQDPDTGYSRRQILPVPTSTLPIDLTLVDLPAGAVVRFGASSFARIRQQIWVQAGGLTFVEGEEEHRLETGDVLELGPPQDCRFENRTRETCTYVVIVLRDWPPAANPQ